MARCLKRRQRAIGFSGRMQSLAQVEDNYSREFSAGKGVDTFGVTTPLTNLGGIKRSGPFSV
jgi:hypothetical protein